MAGLSGVRLFPLKLPTKAGAPVPPGRVRPPGPNTWGIVQTILSLVAVEGHTACPSPFRQNIQEAKPIQTKRRRMFPPAFELHQHCRRLNGADCISVVTGLRRFIPRESGKFRRW